MPKNIPLQQGQRFNRLTVVALHHKKTYIYPHGHNKAYREYYLCKCDCGKTTIVYKDSLKRGKTKSCGCWNGEIKSKVHTKHGMEGTRIYKIWQGIKKRCYRKTYDKYHLYGGRGITMCNEWKNDFVPFYNWAMSNGYKENLTLDRIDVNGNYEPSNCRWATQKEQMRNMRKNHILEYNNEKHCIAEWAEILNINPKTIYNRIYSGWSVEKALNNADLKYE